MQYPDFLKKKDTIGICAPSAGVGKKLVEYEESLSVLKNAGYQIKETASVRINDVRSNTASIRAREFHELLADDEVSFIGFAAGGDYMYEMLGDVDFDMIRKHPKWLMGASDPTNLLYPVTTLLDIATIYGYNAGGYSLDGGRSNDDNLRIIAGDIIKQKSYGFYKTFLDEIDGNDIKYPVNWKSDNDFKAEGRLIGGCFDVISTLMGTPFDGAKDFIRRYQDDGIIWYFDNYARNSFDFYLTLLQMKYAGYFEHCRAVLLGRHAFGNEENMTYYEAMKRVLGAIPFAYDLDIGHTTPCMTLINGSYATFEISGNKGSIVMELR